MTNIKELYDICSRENITIDFIDCPKCGAISLFGAGGCAIGIDSQTPARLLKERTAHEIGHCVKGAFYNRYATADNISQHEYRADDRKSDTEKRAYQSHKEKSGQYLSACTAF